MKLTPQRGREIREKNSGIEEIKVCNEQGLIHKGGSRKKIDGIDKVDPTIGSSIKNSGSSSTQVHLTTQKAFSEYFNLSQPCKVFLEKFCGNEKIANNGLDRYYPSDIEETKEFQEFLNEKKMEIVEYIVRGKNKELVEDIFWKNSKTNITYKISYSEILKKVSNCNWVVLKGGIHLKNDLDKSYFHFQREGKRNKSNRYNVLFHIHFNLFI